MGEIIATKKQKIHFVVLLILTFGIGYLPPVGDITPYGMKTLGVFVGLFYGWVFFDLFWTSVFGFVALALTGLTTAAGALATGMGNQQLLIIIVSLFVAGACEQTELTTYFTKKLLGIKLLNKNPWFLIFGIVTTAYIMGVVGVGLAAVILLWSLVIKMFDICKAPKDNMLLTMIIALIVIGMTQGSRMMPFHAGGQVALGFLKSAMPTLEVPYVAFIVISFLTMFIPMVLLIMLLKVVFKINASMLTLPESVLEELMREETTQTQKYGLFFLTVYIAALLLPSIFPSIPGMAELKKLGIVGVGFIVLLVMAIVRADDKPLINLPYIFKNYMQWPMVLLVAVIFPVVACMNSADSGIIVTLTKLLSPLTQGYGLIPFMVIAMLIPGILTQFTHNAAIGAVFIPLFVPLCVQAGGNPNAMFFLLYVAFGCSFATPAASATSALIFGHELVIRKYAYIIGILYFIISMILAPIIAIPLSNILAPF